jgi:hypothetical protein
MTPVGGQRGTVVRPSYTCPPQTPPTGRWSLWEYPSCSIPLGLPCPCGTSPPHRRRPQGMSLSERHVRSSGAPLSFQDL